MENITTLGDIERKKKLDKHKANLKNGLDICYIDPLSGNLELRSLSLHLTDLESAFEMATAMQKAGPKYQNVHVVYKQDAFGFPNVRVPDELK